ncbi:hypothetical protein AHF37_07203 [Paragonimus kellicotti]|nr:hypothetical protein AHF37_07203 [Paragonimus kellicotti]
MRFLPHRQRGASKVLQFHIRTLLVHTSHFVYTGLKDGIFAVGHVQRTVAKLVTELRNTVYESRFGIPDVHSLEFWRLRYNLISIHFFNGNFTEHFFIVANNNSRRENAKRLYKLHPRPFLGQRLFSCRVINHWNSLSSWAR